MDATFVGNHALGPSGGAISAEGGSDVTAIRCTFADNEASGGGAVYGAGRATRVSIESCVLEQNRATKEGGALRAYSLGFLFTERWDLLRYLALRSRGGRGGRGVLFFFAAIRWMSGSRCSCFLT